jgi:hypothetical protein
MWKFREDTVFRKKMICQGLLLRLAECRLVSFMGVIPKLTRAVGKRTTSAGCISCSEQLELSIGYSGDGGAIRIYVEKTGLMIPKKIYDAPYTLAKGQVNNWSFKVPYWSNKSLSVNVKTGPAGSETWKDRKTLTPTA